MDTPTIWVTNWDQQDVSDAKRFGSVVNVTEGKVDVFKLDRLASQVKDIIDKMSRPGDYIVPCGSSVVTGLVMTYFARKHGAVRLLIFSHRDKKYEPREAAL